MSDAGRVALDTSSIFQLSKASASSTVSITVDFAPLGLGRGVYPSAKTVPIFNPDGRHYTPTFILPIDEVSIRLRLQTPL